MNFSGLMRNFPSALKPARISFRYRIASTGGVRSYFNVFLSSASAPYADNDVFYSGSASHPPAPVDVFSFLVDTADYDSHNPFANLLPRSMLWLPSGRNATVTDQTSTENASDGGWHRVCIEFDWTNMLLLCHVDCVWLRCGPAPDHNNVLDVGSRSFSFGPHQALVAAAEGDESEEQRDAERMVRSMREGFTRLYLFTWLDGDVRDDEPTPDVRIADLWIE